KHGYDRAGNRIWREEPVDGSDSHDEAYRYDGIHRLIDLDRGGLNAAKTAISTLKFAECWGLDATANWQDFRQDADGNGVWDLVQGRNANTANEITLISASAGPTWATPDYDRSGNMTSIPKPS